MNGRTFIDSNVFLYALEENQSDKREKCGAWLRHLLESGSGIANLQVMNEVTNVLLKRARMAPERVFATIDGYGMFGMTALNVETVAAARLIHYETGYSWWDSLLLASAMELQCSFFLTEDLQNGRRVRGLTIVSPFSHSPPDLMH